MSNKDKVFWLKCCIHLSALGLLVNQYYLAIYDQLGGDPVKAMIHFTGIGALNLLVITLLISPLVKRFKITWLMMVRRLLGLYAFVYALCHILNFLFFEVQFDWQLFISEIIERPYITVGLVAFIILFALAMTSISRIQRKMGRRWQTLHNNVYLASVLVGVHFYWSVKSEIIEPSIYLFVVLILIMLRKQKILRWFK
jgi:sulfoxide reductase heme-binding subunit YedZ